MAVLSVTGSAQIRNTRRDITLPAACFKQAAPVVAIMVNLDELYNERILELAAHIPHTARLASPDATATAHSKLCGSRITVDVSMVDGVVTEYGQEVRACLLGQTSAAVIGAHIIGSTAEELRAAGRQMRRMLKEGGEPPSGKWADLAVLEPVRGYRARHASTLLVFDAVEDALRQIEARRSSAAAG